MNDPIHIRVNPMLAEVMGDIPPAALDALSATVKTPTHVPDQGYRYDVTRETFFDRKSDKLLLPAGLVPRFIKELQRLDLSFKIDDRLDRVSPFDISEPDNGFDSPDDEDFAAEIEEHRRGQILVKSLREAIFYIALLGLLFVRHHTVVVAKTRKRIRRIRDGIRELTNRPVTTDVDRVWRMKRRFLVCSPDRYRLCGLEDWQLVIFSDAESACCESSLKRLNELGPCRRYVTVQYGKCRPHAEQLRLEMATGAEIYRSPAVPPPFPPAWIIMAEVHGEQVPAGLNPLERKRQGIWESAERNALIVNVANALRRGELTALRKLGVPSDVMRRWTHLVDFIGRRDISTSPFIQVGVVVEVPEHARLLRALLHPHAAIASQDKEPDELLWLTVDEPIVILTGNEARQAGLPSIVIRADGTGTSMSDLLGQWPGTESTNPHLLVDLHDIFDEQAAQDTFRRRSDYLDHGHRVEQRGHQTPRRSRRKA
jgi:hypothetical protein